MVVDEWPLLRLGVAQALRGTGVTVAASVAGGDEAVQRLRASGAGFLVLGSHRDLDVAETVRRAHAVPSSPRILVLVDHPSRDELEALRAVGVHALLPRSVGAEELAGAVVQVGAGERVIAPSLLSAVFDALGPGGGGLAGDGSTGDRVVREQRVGDRRHHEAGLTPRELDVLGRLVQGRSNKEIADDLFVTPSTVKTHLVHIYAKLGVADRREAMGRAVAIGILG